MSHGDEYRRNVDQHFVSGRIETYDRTLEGIAANISKGDDAAVRKFAEDVMVMSKDLAEFAIARRLGRATKIRA